MFNLFRFCRKNRSTCSIRQCCFDIVAGVDGTLCTSTVWVAMIIICMRQTRRRRCANCSSSYCRPCRRRRYPTVDPMTYYFRCDYRDIFALAWTAVTLSHYRDHVPVASASRRVLCNYSPPPWFAEGGKQAAHGARTSRCLFRRVISVLKRGCRLLTKCAFNQDIASARVAITPKDGAVRPLRRRPIFNQKVKKYARCLGGSKLLCIAISVADGISEDTNASAGRDQRLKVKPKLNKQYKQTSILPSRPTCTSVSAAEIV